MAIHEANNRDGSTCRCGRSHGIGSSRCIEEGSKIGFGLDVRMIGKSAIYLSNWLYRCNDCHDALVVLLDDRRLFRSSSEDACQRCY
jgi:hypothetical protein